MRSREFVSLTKSVTEMSCPTQNMALLLSIDDIAPKIPRPSAMIPT